MTKRFTLVELLMVTAMIALIAALIIVGYNGVYRSWSSRNTIGTMKAAQIALDKYRLENGSFPYSSGKDFKWEIDDDEPEESKLAEDLLQACAPYADKDNNEVTVYDDFGKKKPLRYIYPFGTSRTFALFSAGKDGIFGADTEDDIIFLPAGYDALQPGFYMVKISESGVIDTDADIEPLAQ